MRRLPKWKRDAWIKYSSGIALIWLVFGEMIIGVNGLSTDTLTWLLIPVCILNIVYNIK